MSFEINHIFQMNHMLKHIDQEKLYSLMFRKYPILFKKFSIGSDLLGEELIVSKLCFMIS